MSELTHFNESGRARMVDVSAKPSTERIATAQGYIRLKPYTLAKIQQGKIDPSFVITHRARIDDARKMYETFAARAAGCIKVILKPNENGSVMHA